MASDQWRPRHHPDISRAAIDFTLSPHHTCPTAIELSLDADEDASPGPAKEACDGPEEASDSASIRCQSTNGPVTIHLGRPMACSMYTTWHISGLVTGSMVVLKRMMMFEAYWQCFGPVL
ncbi:hypothetical protein M409DRAFT_24526 [Zasmidium cellare ATCC 36951]|uniref:Uncharacterized protein n=1 Tax=Zasmidium cellare ATCC 36951 TaxID=1080233 RepID=A0A6A6CD54_ZASCE|nr:uncharacterized protein M409DRAFT_24526 [Zasmidium cellare ATCC 36951]KAF2165137.1 hypothetical protein M409DRAFT_24526 [Zasmidium cellare ATCC 36951]